MSNTKKQKTKGYIYAIISSILFGIMAILVKLALETGLDPFDVVFFRFFFASFIIAGYIFLRHIHLGITKGQAWRLIFLSIVGYSAMNLTYYAAFNRMSVALTGMLHYIYPVAAVVIARLVFKGNITKKQYIAVGLAVGGAMILSFGDISQMDPLGLVLALLSGILYGVYAVGLGRPALKDLDGATIVFYLCLCSTICLGATEVIRGVNPFTVISKDGLLIILAVALFCTGFAMILFRQAIVSIGSVPTTILSTLEPITALILSIIFLGDPLTPWLAIGSFLILLAVILTVEWGSPCSQRYCRQKKQM